MEDFLISYFDVNSLIDGDYTVKICRSCLKLSTLIDSDK